jgi:predicted nucleic acid-binding protein
MRKIVINSTPLIALSAIGKLDLLKLLYGKLYIPYGVFEEVCLEGNIRIDIDIIRNNNYVDDINLFA